MRSKKTIQITEYHEKIIEIAQDLEKSKKENKIKFWVTFSISLVALVSSIVFGIIALI